MCEMSANKAVGLLIFWIVSGWLLSSESQAELYLAGQVGVTVPQAFSDVKGIGPLTGFTFSDLKMHNAPVYGLKVGYFFPSLPWLGVESEAYHTTPHVKQQLVTSTSPGGTTTTSIAHGLHTRMTTWAFNLLVRYPGERLQPYAGAGLGIFFARFAGGGPDLSTSTGLNVLAGSRFFLTTRLALFGEYKFNRASFAFAHPDFMIRGDYSAHLFVVGLALHF